LVNPERSDGRIPSLAGKGRKTTMAAKRKAKAKGKAKGKAKRKAKRRSKKKM
jgi:hypothetical protein